MEEFADFGSRTYGSLFLVLLLARSMDFLSTWIATPNLLLEGNPIARRLGWVWGIPVNIIVCTLFAFWPTPAVVISTTSLLVAARNFQSAWLMRSLGERVYRDWYVARIQQASSTLYVFCLLAQTGLIAAVGGAVIFFGDWTVQPILPAIGLGITAYAIAVLLFTSLSIWRIRRPGQSAARFPERTSIASLPK